MMYIFQLLLYIAVHIVAAEIGFFINDQSEGISTFFWPPAGISLAVLLLFGYRFLPGLFLGGLLASLQYGAPLPVAISSGIGSTLTPFLAAYIAKRFFKFNNSLQHTRDVVGLLLVGVPISSIVIATLITFGFLRGGLIEASVIPAVWTSVWICNVLSANIISTLILVWYKQWKIRFSTVKRFWESVALVAFYAFLSVFMFTNVVEKATSLLYLIFVPLVWAALRFGIREVVTIIFAFSVMAIWSTLGGLNPVLSGDVDTSVLYLEGFISVVLFTIMILVVAVAERKEHEQRKDNFISMASHELRTPLTSVKMMTQVLVKKNHDKKEKDYLEGIDQQLDKLTRLINEMLDLSKIQAHKLKIKKEPFSLEVLLKQIKKNMSITTPTHEVEIHGTSDVTMYGDKDRIEQVLVNLLSNAIKYSPKSDKVVVLVDSDKKDVTIGVRDSGIGITKNDLRKVFERFYRVDKGHENTGFGLGLYIASEIIRQHEGKIWVESELGKGSTFYFSLPRS